MPALVHFNCIQVSLKLHLWSTLYTHWISIQACAVTRHGAPRSRLLLRWGLCAMRSLGRIADALTWMRQFSWVFEIFHPLSRNNILAVIQLP